MSVFGHDQAPHGHMHIKFDNCRVPKENIILGEDVVLDISRPTRPRSNSPLQRSIGVAEQFELLCRRA